VEPVLDDARPSTTSSLDPAPADGASSPALPRLPGGPWSRAAMGVALAAALVGILLRWWPRSVLWLDEAQSVSFASLPISEIPGALREDGAPPLYYVLLHGWMRLFGSGDVSVRALSALLSTAALAVVVVFVRRRWGTAAALAAFVLVATSPFAVRYATHARMYSLVVLEVVLGLVLVDRALRRDSWGRLVAVSALAAALLYTHYWALYLLAVTAATLLVTSRMVPLGSALERARRRTAVAVVGGFALWLPWVPTFLFQSRRTATPWAAPANAAAALQVFASSAGGRSSIAVLLGIVVAAMFLVGMRVRGGAGALETRAVGVVGTAAAAAAVSGAIVSSSAVSVRYFAVAIPLVLVTAAVGVARLSVPWRAATLAVIGLLGIWLARQEVVTPRTTADDVARLIERDAAPGDLVVYCPDQLSPAMHRLLARSDLDLRERVFPPGSQPARVDWIDYTERAREADPDAFVRRLAAEHDGSIWLVVSLTYPPTEPACGGLLLALQQESSAWSWSRLLADRPDLDEHGALWRFVPVP
jgi:mannosyltransferase